MTPGIFDKIEIQYGYMRALPDVGLVRTWFPLAQAGCAALLERWLGHAREVSKWAMLVSNQFVTPSVMIKREVHHRFYRAATLYGRPHALVRVVCAGDRVVKLPGALAAIYKDPFGVTGLSSACG